jgi:2-polyprenyl-3-methyl-5-hydroxy-6-metoxy-1,4-benzoquinol methylase
MNSIKKAVSKLRRTKEVPIEKEKTLVFDETTYLADYPDVAKAVQSGAFASGEAHFNQYGYHEGRIASGIKRPKPLKLPFTRDSRPSRRDKILANLEIEKLDGLEIGALSSPLVTHYEGNIFNVDHVDTETLLKKYSLDPSVEKSKIVHVDAVWGAQSLQECIGKKKKVDYVVASHVIEHVPDLITWLNEVHSILREGGSLRLAIPDRRYTFDYLKSESRLHDVIEAFVRQARTPSPRMILEHAGYARVVDCSVAWAGKLNTSELKPYNNWTNAISLAKDAFENGTYHDSHCWIFTPVTFVDLCHAMVELDLLHYACDYLIETPHNQLEFYISMSPCKDKTEIVASWQRTVEQLRNSETYQHV